MKTIKTFLTSLFFLTISYQAFGAQDSNACIEIVSKIYVPQFLGDETSSLERIQKGDAVVIRANSNKEITLTDTKGALQFKGSYGYSAEDLRVPTQLLIVKNHLVLKSVVADGADWRGPNGRAKPGRPNPRSVVFDKYTIKRGDNGGSFSLAFHSQEWVGEAGRYHQRPEIPTIALSSILGSSVIYTVVATEDGSNSIRAFDTSSTIAVTDIPKDETILGLRAIDDSQFFVITDRGSRIFKLLPTARPVYEPGLYDHELQMVWSSIPQPTP